jgi:hypothetical protein
MGISIYFSWYDSTLHFLFSQTYLVCYGPLFRRRRVYLYCLVVRCVGVCLVYSDVYVGVC